MTTAVSDASQQSYNWTRMNRGSDPANQGYQLLDSSMGVRTREEAKKAEPRDKTMIQERCLVGVLALATGVGSP